MEYFLELFPDKTSGATANQANADNAAQKAARDFCHTMEKTYVTNVDDVADTVSNALRAKLQVTYPYGLIVDRTEATNVVHAAVQEFRRMAQEPAKFKNAADYVNTWENDKPPTTLIEIEKHFMTRLTKLAIDIHNVQEYFRGTKIGVFIGEEYAPFHLVDQLTIEPYDKS